MQLTVLGILPIMIDSRKNMHQEIISHIKSNYDIPIFQQHIRSCVKAAEAPSFGKSVLHYAPSSNTARDYINFAQEVLKTIPVNYN